MCQPFIGMIYGKENMGFEPMHRFNDLTVFETVPLTTWVILQRVNIRTCTGTGIPSHWVHSPARLLISPYSPCFYYKYFQQRVIHMYHHNQQLLD